MKKLMGDNVEIVKQTDVFEGFFGFKHFDLKYKRFDGTMSKTVNRELFIGKKAVIILPFDPANDKIVFVEQIRFAAALIGENPYVMEVPAGVVDSDDSPYETALRELKEEAGLETKEVFEIYDYMPSPGCFSEHIWFYCGIVDANSSSRFGGLEEEGEDIKVHIIDYKDALDMLNNNKIRNANTVIALQWLAMNRERLRKQYL